MLYQVQFTPVLELGGRSGFGTQRREGGSLRAGLRPEAPQDLLWASSSPPLCRLPARGSLGASESLLGPRCKSEL